LTLALAGVTEEEARAVDRGATVDTHPEIGRFWRSANGQPQWSCTATLVAPHFVLTAAHCVGFSWEHPEQYSFGVMKGTKSYIYQAAVIHNFGENRSWGDGIPNDDQLNAVPRPASGSGRGNNDVALVQLASSVPSDVANPAGVAAWYIDPGITVSLYGYGAGLCHGVWPSGEGTKRVNSWTYQIHGGDNPQQLDPSGIICGGDSGGPAVTGGPNDNGVIWGVASSTSSLWDWYGDVVYYRPWMDDIVRGTPQPVFRKPLCTNDWWNWWDPHCPNLSGVRRLM
jgi:hypothetical protein